MSSKNEILLTEYKMCQEMHNYYGRITWEIGSILIGGGVAMLGLVASRLSRPSVIFSFFAIIFTIMIAFFIFSVRRFRQISEVHLARCREIETTLDMKQHRYCYKANEPCGVKIKWDDREQTIKVPLPSSWNMLWIMSLSLTILVWIIAIYLAMPTN